MTAVTETGTAGSERAASLAAVVQRQGAAVVLVLGIVAAWFAFPRFGSPDNLRDLALQGSFLAVIALGMTFVIISGGIDLSVGSVYALGGVLAAYGSQYGLVVAIAAPVVICALIGLVNGLLIARTKMAPFIVTLASLLFARGLLLALTNEGATTYKVPDGPRSCGWARARSSASACPCTSRWSSSRSAGWYCGGRGSGSRSSPSAVPSSPPC